MVLPTSSLLHISFTGIVLSDIKTFAILIFCESIFFGLPPSLPLARADFRPAWVRSRISPLSNSANDPKI